MVVDIEFFTFHIAREATHAIIHGDDIGIKAANQKVQGGKGVIPRQVATSMSTRKVAMEVSG